MVARSGGARGASHICSARLEYEKKRILPVRWQEPAYTPEEEIVATVVMSDSGSPNVGRNMDDNAGSQNVVGDTSQNVVREHEPYVSVDVLLPGRLWQNEVEVMGLWQ